MATSVAQLVASWDTMRNYGKHDHLRSGIFGAEAGGNPGLPSGGLLACCGLPSPEVTINAITVKTHLSRGTAMTRLRRFESITMLAAAAFLAATCSRDPEATK